MKGVIGGTFDVLHEGHRKLFDVAFGFSDEVLIGLTTDEYARKSKKRRVRAYGQRKADLEAYLKGKKYNVEPISDPYGPSVFLPDLDAIVVSTETLERAHEINAIRESKGLKPLVIIVIPLVTDSKGRKVSARDIDGRDDIFK